MEVRPFQAYRFDPRVVGEVGRCIAPPYDVIGDEDREALYARSEHNIVRITQGRADPSDNGQCNQYSRAAECLKKWMEEGALRQDERETIYGYVQDYELNGQAFQRLTFIALGKLEDFGKVVRPHEQVFAKPMQDRLNLKRATAARFGLVFMLYDDPEGVADKIIARAATQEPLVDFVDDEGVRHRLFGIADPEETAAIATMMADKPCTIADGHHRYTTGLTYMRESGNPAARYQMLAFTNASQKGVVVLATHRVVGGIEGFGPREFLARLESGFALQGFAFAADGDGRERAKQKMLAEMHRLGEQGRTAFGIYMADGAFHLAVLKDRSFMDAAAPDKSDAWRELDVSVLQKLILEGLLGLDDEQMGDPSFVAYVKDRPNAIDQVIGQIDAGRRQVAFFTNPVRMSQLMRVTETGERMPHKSTYFYPKMYTGLTIQKL